METGAPRDDLFGVWAGDNDDVFVVGESGIILHYDGRDWEAVNSRTVQDLFALWGTSEAYLFSVGKSGTIVHYDGNEWTAVRSATGEDLAAVWGRDDGDEVHVFAVGAGNTAVR